MHSQDVTDDDLGGPVVDRRTTLKILGGSAGSAALAGCAGEKGGGGGGGETATTGSKSKKRGGKLTAGWKVSEVTNLDPVLNSVGVNEQAAMLVHNALLVTDKNLRIHGELAKDWTVENQTKYTFQLREGVQFHGDYGEVTAEDVKYTLMRGLTAEGSTAKPKLSLIKKPYKENITVKDDYTIEIQLEKPFVPFLKALSRGGGACSVHPKKAVEDLGSKFKSAPIGCGPFEVKEHKVGSHLTLSRNGDYWKTDDDGVQLPYLDEVKIKPIASTSTLINGLKGGDLDYLQDVPKQNLKKVKQSGKAKAYSAPSGGWGAMYFNMEKDKFSDQKTRRAVSNLINQEEFVKQAYFGFNSAAVGPLSPIHGFANRPKDKKPDHQDYKPEEGKKLLKEAGYSKSNPLKFTLMAEKSEMRPNRVLKRMLNKYDLMDVELSAVDASTFVDRLHSKSGSEYYDAAIWGSDIDLTPDTTMYFFFLPQPEGAYNNMGYGNENVTKWLKEQRQVFDQKKRAELFHKAEDQVMEDAPCAFLDHFTPWVAASPDIGGVWVHPFRRPLEDAYLKK